MATQLRASPPAAPESAAKRMKGIGFANIQAYVRERHGAPAWSDLLSALSAADRDDLGSVIAVGWYDSYLFARLLRQLDLKFGKGDLQALKGVGGYEAERDFNRVLRLLMRVVSPLQIFRTHARLWSHFQDSGEWKMSPLSGGMRGVLTGWAVDEALCHELTGYLVRMIEFTGGKQVQVKHTECRARGASRCAFDFYWA